MNGYISLIWLQHLRHSIMSQQHRGVYKMPSHFDGEAHHICPTFWSITVVYPISWVNSMIYINNITHNEFASEISPWSDIHDAQAEIILQPKSPQCFSWSHRHRFRTRMKHNDSSGTLFRKEWQFWSSNVSLWVTPCWSNICVIYHTLTRHESILARFSRLFHALTVKQ